MKKELKKALLLTGTCLMLGAFCGCGEANAPAPAPESTEPETVAETVVDEDQASDIDDTASSPYKTQIDSLKADGLADQFALADIDGDGTPELIASDSSGSYDHENAFIYTVYDGKCVLLASAISGADGASLCYSEGKNLIRQSGAVAGAGDVFSKIKDGKLEEIFKAEMINTLQTDENDEEIFSYSVNGEEVDEKSYTEAIAGFIKDYDPLIRIDYDGLNKITFKQEQDTGWFEQTETGKYSTEEEITKQL